MFSIPMDTLAFLGIVVSIAGTVWTFAMWLSSKLNAILETFYQKIDSVGTMILEKLEYHQRHDDERFNAIHGDLSDIRISNAARDASTTKYRNKHGE